MADKIRVVETKTVDGKTYYRVSDGHPFLTSGWLTAESVAELRRKSKK